MAEKSKFERDKIVNWNQKNVEIKIGEIKDCLYPNLGSFLGSWQLVLGAAFSSEKRMS